MAEHQWWCDTNSSQHCKGPRVRGECNCTQKVRPCYICGETVGLTEGWHRLGSQWCENHQPVWSRERLICNVPHPDDKRVLCARRYGHGGDHAATTKGPQTQWWKPRDVDWNDLTDEDAAVLTMEQGRWGNV